MRDSLIDWLDNYDRHSGDYAVASRRGYRMLRWRYRDILHGARRFARELESRGIARGDRVGLWGENCPEWVVAFLGCILRGAVAVPMDRIAAPEFVVRVFEQVDAKLVVVSHEVAPQVTRFPLLLLEELKNSLGQHSMEPFASPELERSDPVEIVFTSGTTADPKGVVISHGNVLANLEPLEREIAKYLRYER